MMKTDTLLRQEGMRVLSENLGIVEAERFISLIIRELFDCTEWQRGLYNGVSLEKLCEEADSYWKESHK
jgi:hypothetical protein